MKNRTGLGEKPARMKGNEESGGKIWTDEPPDSAKPLFKASAAKVHGFRPQCIAFRQFFPVCSRFIARL